MESSSKKKEEKKNNTLIIAGAILMVIAVVLIVWFFLQGQTTVTGGYPEPVVATSLTCKSNTYAYPFFIYDNSKSKELTTKVIFENDKLKNISLIYSLKYDTVEAITESETWNHGEMNTLFGKDQLEADAFSATYSRMSDQMKFNIYADATTLNSNGGRKYFLLDGAGQGPYSLKTIKTLYEQKGLKCEQKS